MNERPLRVVGRRQGQILTVPRGVTLDRQSSDAAQVRSVPAGSEAGILLGRTPHLRGVLTLLLALPMFTQCFQYMTDIPPLYLLSKVWPVLMLPIAVWASLRLDIPYKPLHLMTLFWLSVVTPMISVMHLGNGFSDAMATTVKIWSFSYVFAAAGIFMIMQVSSATIRRVIIGLGIGTFVILTLLWITVPTSWYGGTDLDTKLFMTDVERGYRIYMPMYFGVMLILYLNRSAWIRFAWWKPAAIIAALCLMVMIYKQRAAIASVLLALVLGSVLSMRRWRMAALAVFGSAACAGCIVLLTRSQTAAEVRTDLGASLAVRQVTVGMAWNYITFDPVRWVFGVGGTTRLGEVTLAKLFNNPMFFLADIGWLGVLFEYGAAGVMLMLLVYCCGLRSAAQWSHPKDALSQALVDYILYLLAASVVYSAVFTPGELTTTMALSYYLSRASRLSGGNQGIVLAQDARPSPRQIALARSLPVGRSG